MAELARRPDGVLLGADRHRDERIGHAEVGVLTQPGDDEQLVAARVHVEVIAVVEIAVGCDDMIERVGCLVGKELVESAEWHVPSPHQCLVGHAVAMYRCVDDAERRDLVEEVDHVRHLEMIVERGL